jgi:uncharacterized membrane protein
MTRKHCLGCHAEMDADAIFCNHCGRAHSDPSQPAARHSPPEPAWASSAQVTSGIKIQQPVTDLSPPPVIPETPAQKFCPKCGKGISVAFRFCPACSHDFLAETPALKDYEPTAEEFASNDGSPISERLIVAAKTRYKDAYYYARFIDTVGRVLKAVGFIGAALAILLGLAAAGSAAQYGVMRALDAGFGGMAILFMFGLYAALWLGIWWLFGTLCRASAQFLKASLDSAVHSSPFLSDLERADVMSLPLNSGAAASTQNRSADHDTGIFSDRVESPAKTTWFDAALTEQFQSEGWLARTLGPLKPEKAAMLCYLSPILMPAIGYIFLLATVSILGYAGFLVGMLGILISPFLFQAILLQIRPHSGNPFVRFHAVQSLLEVGAYSISALAILGIAYLRKVALDGPSDVPSAVFLLGTGHLLLLIFMCVKANAANAYKLPLIGTWSATFASNNKPSSVFSI